MAGVVRLSSGRIVQKYFLSLATKNIKRNIKINQRICFHSTSFLDVMAQEVNMPSLSPTMTTGTIVQWLKKEGDNVVPGDVLCEIQTDKAVMAFETEEEGILAKILVEPGTKDVKVGTLIALMVGEGEDWKRVEIPCVTASVLTAAFGSSSSPSSARFSTSGSSSAPAGSSGDSKGSSGGTVPGQELKMPALSPTMTEGTIVSWKKKEGEKINPGDALCEIQTDKAVMTFEIEEEGILAKILVPAGTANVKVGTLIALTVEPDADWTQVRIPGAAAAAPAPSAPAPVAAAPTVVSGTVRGQDIKMPALSPTMTEGTIISWKKKEGEKINPGDALCEIQTDKAVMTFEMEEEGILAKILVPEGTANVKIGTLIALTVEEGQDWKDVMVTTGGGSSVSAAVTPGLPATPPTVVAAMTGGSTPGTEVKMPALSPTMSEGVIVSWTKKEGDKLSPGDVLCEIQTDKAVMGFEIEEEAILAKILAPASSKVTVGSLIALTVEEGQDWKDVAVPATAGAPAPAAAAAAPTRAAPTAAKPAAAPVHTGFHLEGDWAPAVRNLLETYQLTGKEVTATGPKKRVLKADVLKYIRDNNLQPKPPVPVPLPGKKGAPAGGPSVGPAARAPTARYTDKEVSSMRKTIASRLTQSKTQIPHAYSTLEARVDDLLTARKQLQNLGIKVSVNDFVLKAVSKALKQCPYVNTLYVKDEIKPSPTVDISVAVATDSGLITPIIKNADQKTVDQISEEIRVLANKARQGKLQLHEFQGGSFTVSNLGMFGISTFSAIINPPQCAILAVGGGRQVIKLDGKPATVMSATLSYDSRAISEDEVAAFMEVLTGYLENPASLLLFSTIRPTVKLNADQRTT